MISGPTLPSLVQLGLVFATGFVVSAVLQPIVRRFAVMRGLLDYPDDNRRNHITPIPRLGGVGVVVGVSAALLLGAVLAGSSGGFTLSPFILALAVGSLLLFVTGLVDDIRGVPPIAKLIVQSVAALILWQVGFQIRVLAFPPSYVIPLGVIALPVTLVWIIGVSNAFNLVDGADGLAGGVGIIALVATALSAVVLHDVPVLWCSVALIGALLGFLRLNFPPARIFLGDSGSLVVGFLLAVLTVRGMTRPDGALYAIGPIFALSYPLLDTGMAILRRWLRGDPLSRADGRHIHHQLQLLDMGPRVALLVLYSLSAVVALLGISATYAPQLTLMLGAAGSIVLLSVMVFGARWLQYHELIEIGTSISNIVLHGRSRVQDKIHARDVARLIDNANGAEELMRILATSAPTFRFSHMQLRWSTSRENPPLPIIADVQRALLWSFDYPVLARTERADPLFLSVWCDVRHRRPAGAERVTRILAPAVAQWMRFHPEELHAPTVRAPHELARNGGAMAIGDRRGAALVLERDPSPRVSGPMDGSAPRTLPLAGPSRSFQP